MTFVAGHHTVLVFRACVFEKMEVVHACHSHVEGMDYVVVFRRQRVVCFRNSIALKRNGVSNPALLPYCYTTNNKSCLFNLNYYQNMMIMRVKIVILYREVTKRV